MKLLRYTRLAPSVSLANGPSPRTVQMMAITEATSAPVVAPRCPNRSAAQSDSG